MIRAVPGVNSFGIDEINNRLSFGVSSRLAAWGVAAVMTSAGAPTRSYGFEGDAGFTLDSD